MNEEPHLPKAGTAHGNVPGSPAEGEVGRLGRLLADPKVREIVAQIAREEVGEEPEEVPTRWQRLSAFVAGASSALVVLLAFLVPSMEDQWDRFQSRRVVQRHVELARTFMAEGRYKLAEESFARAFEQSENKRLDIEEERLEARVERVNADPTWAAENPEGLEESDFLYLLAFQDPKSHAAERAATLTAYGAFLAGARRGRDAERALREAVALAPRQAGPHVHLGNVLRERGANVEAEAEYRVAIAVDPEEPHAHYDLGLVLSETGRLAEAATEFRRVVALEPEDGDGWRGLGETLEALGQAPEARTALERARRLEGQEPPGKRP